MNAPLAGLRVVELARILAGPWAGQVLADLGADVIKVESPEGDETRHWGPPFVRLRRWRPRCGLFPRLQPRQAFGGRGLRDARGRGARAASCAPARTSSSRTSSAATSRATGSMPRRCARAHPRLICCSITGFGQDGPYADRPGYDFIVQAMGGIMDLTGEADGAARRSRAWPTPICSPACTRSIAIQAALLRRARSGEGAFIDLSLLDTQVAVLANQAMNFLVSGEAPRRMGNAHPNLVPYQVFTVADGELVIAVGNDAQFRRLADVLGLPSSPHDPAMRTQCGPGDATARGSSRRCSRRCRRWTRARAGRAPDARRACRPGRSTPVAEVFADPQVRRRQMAGTASPPGTASRCRRCGCRCA